SFGIDGWHEAAACNGFLSLKSVDNLRSSFGIDGGHEVVACSGFLSLESVDDLRWFLGTDGWFEVSIVGLSLFESERWYKIV
ncbi:unnamed protein product, partial [Rotaria sp. Silwood1]